MIISDPVFETDCSRWGPPCALTKSPFPGGQQCVSFPTYMVCHRGACCKGLQPELSTNDIALKKKIKNPSTNSTNMIFLLKTKACRISPVNDATGNKGCLFQVDTISYKQEGLKVAFGVL